MRVRDLSSAEFARLSALLDLYIELAPVTRNLLDRHFASLLTAGDDPTDPHR